MTTLIKIKDAPVMGNYQRTSIDAEKDNVDFTIIDMSSKVTIRWKDGRTDMITRKQLEQHQEIYSWKCDF